MLEYIDLHIYKLNTFSEIDNIFYIWLLRSIADNSFLSQCHADWQSSVLIINNDGKEYKIKAILNEYIVNYSQNHYHEYWIK